MVFLPPLSLYIHIPWCIKKCFYCDFHSYPKKKKIPYKKYIQNLINDLDNDLKIVNNREIKTIFIGGGTPSLLPEKYIYLLINSIKKRLTINSKAEITIEANPNTNDIKKFLSYKEAGINRISIGVQSFEKEKLISLGRIHSEKEINNAIKLLFLLRLKSFNIDLMYGLINQSLKDSINDLNKVIILNIPHLSWYQLTIEPKTLFYNSKPKLPKEEILWNIFRYGKKFIISSGYINYEISSYAKPGFQCLHNINYWRFGDYLGIGCGAHGKITQKDGKILRTVKTLNIYKYMNKKYLSKYYQILHKDLPIEYFMNRFRLLENIPRNEFTKLTGISEKKIRFSLDIAQEKGYIIENNYYWIVTEKGRLFLNNLLELFI